MLQEETRATEPTTDTQTSNDAADRRESRDNESRDNESRDNEEDDEDDDEETRAHRDGHRRGGQDFCDHIYVVDEDFHCAEDVRDAIEELFTYTDVHLVENCKHADDDEDVCLTISNSHDCDEVVEDALDELDEFCFADDDDEGE